VDTQLTHLLSRAVEGDDQARNALWEAVYRELHGMAHGQPGRRPGATMQTTALVHEVYLRLLGPDGQGVSWANRRHFFGAAAEALRRIVVDDARKRGRIKRGGDHQRLPLEVEPAVDGPDPGEVLSVHAALDRLERISPRQAQIVKLRYFAGFSIDEVAQLLEVSPRTVDGDWQLARAWLHRELGGGSEPRA
jgi:RNA polymerase sigma factor (TIGR02999 family)